MTFSASTIHFEASDCLERSAYCSCFLQFLPESFRSLGPHSRARLCAYGAVCDLTIPGDMEHLTLAAM